jgi:CubicO group peptidase (beta-lactamase class C family)
VPFPSLAQYVTGGEIPGLVALVSQGGRVEVEAIGTLALGSSQAMRRDTIFRVASMSKPVTAAATMILVDDGAFRLDDPVERFLPELANRRVLKRFDAELDDTVPVTRSITVRDLLAFTMGFGILLVPPRTYPIQRATDDLKLGQGYPQPQIPPPPDEWMRRLGRLPLMSQPGARWIYNTGSDVAGVLIARAAGKPFASFLEERLFGPLGMVDTGFAVPAAKRNRFATSYMPDPLAKGLKLVDPPEGQWSKAPPFPAGAAGLVSTVDDFLAFGEMILGGGKRGKERVLSERSVGELTRDQLTSAQRAASNDFVNYFVEHTWGLGGSIVTGRDDAGPPGTYGWDGGFGTTWRVEPATNRVTILMTQRAMTSPAPPPVYRDFWREVHKG